MLLSRPHGVWGRAETEWSAGLRRANSDSEGERECVEGAKILEREALRGVDQCREMAAGRERVVGGTRPERRHF